MNTHERAIMILQGLVVGRPIPTAESEYKKLVKSAFNLAEALEKEAKERDKKVK